MTALIGEAVTTLGYVPAILPAAISERAFDALSHHRLGVIKDAARMPGGRQAQKFVASRLYRYSRRGGRLPVSFAEVHAEGFAAEPNPKAFSDEAIRNLEYGANIFARGAMAIGYGGPAIDAASWAMLKYIKPRGLLASVEGGRRFVDRGNRELGKVGDRTELFSLRRRRRARPLLGYERRWEVVAPKAVAKLEADLDKVMTIAGQRGLEARIGVADAKRKAYTGAYTGVLAGSPGSYTLARRAGREAAAAVTRDSLGRP
jgi:hypothetical protein